MEIREKKNQNNKKETKNETDNTIYGEGLKKKYTAGGEKLKGVEKQGN